MTIRTPVTATQNQIVPECWYVTDAYGQSALLGTEKDVKHIVELLNQQPDELPTIGGNDAICAISDDGAEFLEAIRSLEGDQRAHYLGWFLFVNAVGEYYATKDDGKYRMRMPSARDMVTAVLVLETNGVTTPETDEVQS